MDNVGNYGYKVVIVIKPKPYSLSVVMTAVNETDSLFDNIETLLKTCNHDDLKEFIIVFSENVTDDCLQAIENAKGIAPSIPLISFCQSQPGLGRAIYEAMRRVSADHVVYLAADGDTDPFLVSKMIESSKAHPRAIILASRWIKGGGFIGYGFLNKVLNRAFNLMLQLLFFTRISDLTYAYRLAPTDLSISVKWESDSFSVGLETNLRMLRLGYEFIELPAVWRARNQGSSSNSFFKKLLYLKYVIKIRFSSKNSNLMQVESERKQ